jgi:WD40 repeat protein
MRCVPLLVAFALILPAEPPAPDGTAIAKLIEQLGSDDFSERESAAKKLEEIGVPALEALRTAAATHSDLEVRGRAKKLVAAIQKTVFGEFRCLQGHRGNGPAGWVMRVSYTPDGKHILSAGGDGMRLWDAATGKEVRAFAERQGGWALALARDGKRVLCTSLDRQPRLWDLETGKEVQKFAGHINEVWGAVLLPEGRQALTGAWDGTLRLWDVETGKQVRPFDGVQGNVRGLALSPDGTRVAAIHFTADNQPSAVRLWDPTTGKVVRSFEGHRQVITWVAWAPDGKTLLTTSFDGTVRVWDVETGKELKRLEGHTGHVEGAAFTHDGKRILSCGHEADPTVRLWDVTSGKELFRSEAYKDGFLGVAVSPDGREAVSCGKDGMVRQWRLPK